MMHVLFAKDILPRGSGDVIEVLFILLLLLVLVAIELLVFSVGYVLVDVVVALCLLLILNRRRHLFWALPLTNAIISAVFSLGMVAVVRPMVEHTGWLIFWVVVVPILSLIWAIVCGLIMAVVHSPIKFSEEELKSRRN